MSADWITLAGMEFFGYHGVLPQERANGQRFVVDLHVAAELSEAASSDDLSNTVDYSALAEIAQSCVEGEACNLIETLAGRIANAVLQQPVVETVRVTVHKPDAPLGVSLADVAVSVERRRA